MRRLGMLAVAVILLTLGTAAGHYTTVHGWDWSVGSDTAYCGVYVPHADVYCQSGN